MRELTSLPNIGETVAQQLEEAGIRTAAQLEEAGSRQAWAENTGVRPVRLYQQTLRAGGRDPGDPEKRAAAGSKGGTQSILPAT